MSAPQYTPEDYRFGAVNLAGSLFWAAVAWGFAHLVGAPHWAAWLLAFLTFNEESNSGGIRYRIKKLIGGGR
jgi:hypothetical protein